MNDRLSSYQEDDLLAAQRLSAAARSDRPALHVALVAGSGPDAFQRIPELAQDLHLQGQRVQLIRPRRHKWEQPASSDRFQEVLLPMLPSPARLVYHWRQHTPDLVYVQDKGYLGWIATHTARQMGLPVCVACHGNPNLAPLQADQGWGSRWQQGLSQRWSRHIRRSAHALLAGTFTDLQQLRQQGLHHAKLALPGIDLSQWSPAQRSLSLRHQWGIRADTPVLAHFGPVEDSYTIHCLRSAMAALLEQHPQARLLLIEAGRIPTRLQALRPLRSQDWRDQPLGRRSGERKPSLATLLASVDILLAPHPDARPELVPHALACGLALVARRTELSQTFIEDGHNGFLVTPAADDLQSPARFGDVLSQLGDEPTLLPRLRLRSRASVAHLERSHSADHLIMVFKEVIQGHQRCQRAAQGLVVAMD